MKIVDVRQTTVPIASTMKNAYIDFSKMDVSVVAVVTDVERDGRRVVGYGFNSNGRYGAARPAAGPLHPPPDGGRPAIAPHRRRREPRPASHLGDADDRRETGRARRALGRGRRHRHGRLGRGRQDRRASRSTGCWPTATGTARPTSGSGSTRPAATTSRARTSTRCRTRCAATSTWATRRSR